MLEQAIRSAAFGKKSAKKMLDEIIQLATCLWEEFKLIQNGNGGFFDKFSKETAFAKKNLGRKSWLSRVFRRFLKIIFKKIEKRLALSFQTRYYI